MPLIGCCGWAGAQAQYFAQFPVIEIQSTFYDPPASKVAARWRATAPPGFEFCIKAWQLITHSASSPTYRRLRQPVDARRSAFFGSFQDTDEVWQAWIKTLEIADAVGASVVLFQCPASFRANPVNIGNLSRFFQKIGPQPFGLLPITPGQPGKLESHDPAGRPVHSTSPSSRRPHSRRRRHRVPESAR